MSFNKNCLSSFADNERLAFCSSDGILHVWDVKTGEQKQQYLPSSHLSAMFTCLAWKEENIKTTQGSTNSKKKKSRLSKVQSLPTEYIAIGTAVGDIVLFNALNGELVYKFSTGHSDQVNCISWAKDDTFYSCSNDQHIVEWSVGDSVHKCKWKAEKREVYSIAVGPHSKTILSGGKMIKLWDLKTKLLLRKYAGHTSPVFALRFLIIPSLLSHQGETLLEMLDGMYFLSAALDDRAVSAWRIKDQKHKKTATCSFALPSEPSMLDLLPPSTPNKPAQLLVVTEDDEVVIFSHTLNGHMKKPLIQSKSIKIVTEEAVSLKIICASFEKDTKDSAVTVIIAYGSAAKVAFEQVNLNNHVEPDVVFIRKDPSKSEVYMEQDKLKLREPIKGKKVSSIVPGLLEHSGEKITGKKRKKQVSLGEAQLTMEERIQALSVEKISSKEDPPRADSFSILLSQGLQSNDKEVLNQVLQHSNETLIRNTVRQLSITYVIPLIKELTTRLQSGPEKCLIFIKWMKATVNCHSSYLMTFPDIIPLLSQLYQLMNVRTQTHSRVCNLEGKLELITSQTASRRDQTTNTSTGQAEALFVFDEDSSDDQEDMEGITIDNADLVNDWDEDSDAAEKHMQDSDHSLSDDELDER